MLCKGCRKEIANESAFCEYCGRNVQNDFEKSFCTSCGKPIEENSLFCKYCGSSIYADTSDKQYGIKHKKTIHTKKNILIILAIIVGVFMGLSFFGNNEEVVEIVDRDKVISVDGIYYKIVNSTLFISGEGEVDRKTINSFPKKSFDSVVFEMGHIDIPDDTFSGFSNIKKIELKNVVNKIGARAFKGGGFYLIAIGKSISQIGEAAFEDCSISDVYLNNPEIRANLNKRDDFGGLFENASTIAIFYSTTQSADEDFTLDESGWGRYLKDNEEYSNLLSIYSSGNTLPSRNYNLWAHAIRPGFFHFYYNTGLDSKKTTLDAYEYDAETNTLTLHEDSDY